MKSTTHINIIFILTCCYSMLMCVGDTISRPYLTTISPIPLRFDKVSIVEVESKKSNTCQDIEYDFSSKITQFNAQKVDIDKVNYTNEETSDFIPDTYNISMSHESLVNEILKFFKD